MKILQRLAAVALFACASPAWAAEVLFDTDPFAGSTALTTPGRQIVGGELSIAGFDPARDLFAFDDAVFGTGALSFFSGAAAQIPASGFNLIVLQQRDNDNNPATPFGAGNAANLIAAQIDTPGAGFFIYHNSGLSLNRLVFSTDLSDPTADLKILARMLAPTGDAGFAALADFRTENFARVPEPASVALLAGGLLATAIVRRRRPRPQPGK